MKILSVSYSKRMDSIFEQPRTTPRPTQVTQNFKAPVVPEASLIFQNLPKDSKKINIAQKLPRQQSYNAWKLQNAPQINAQDSFVCNNDPSNGKENNYKMCQNYADFQYAYINKPACDTSTNKSLLKKVRFERPQLIQPTSTVVMRSPNFDALLRNPNGENKQVSKPVSAHYTVPLTNNYRPPLQNKTQNHNDSLANIVINSPENLNRYQTQHPNKYSSENVAHGPTYNGPYEQIYSNNSPNNKLDLSILDSNKYQAIPKRTETAEALFEKSSLNTDNIKKFALPDHILQQERLKTIQYAQNFAPSLKNIQDTQNILPERKILPTYTQILPDKVIIQNNAEQILSEQNTEQKVSSEISEPNPVNVTEPPKSCICDCNKNAIEQKNDSEQKAETKTDPTVTELLNIVKTQNEQLQLLQNQVQMLIKLNDTTRKNKIQETVENIDKFTKNSEQKIYREPETTKPVQVYQSKTKRYEKEPRNNRRSNNDEIDHRNPRKNIVLYKDEKVGTSYDDGICRRVTKENIITKDTKTEKISVGIMTSFQVSVKSPFEKNKLNRKQHDSEESAISISEDEYPKSYPRNTVFTDTWHNKTNRKKIEHDSSIIDDVSIRDENDYSSDEIGLEEPLRIQEAPLSPNHTVHVDMQDYDSDSDDETSSVEPGWTFYDNILGKVNNILENSPSPHPRREQHKSKRNHQTKKTTDCTMDVIKQATIQNLQKQGFAGGSKEFGDLKPNEISFAVKQLLMKYMSDEDLGNLVNKEERRRVEHVETDGPSTANRYKQEYKATNPSKSRNQGMAPNQGKQIKTRQRSASNSNGAKILDITTLKKQPKLL